MDLLQLREQSIFETLKKLVNCEFVIIGGYAVNAYTLPRFSVDCDIVLLNNAELLKIAEKLEEEMYVKVQSEKYAVMDGKFCRYEKILKQEFKVSIDILIETIHDRQTNAVFDALWIFNNSKLRVLRGKTITEKLKLRIINIDALIVMKFISARSADIRDVFMLIPYAEDLNWIKHEIKKRVDFKSRYDKIKNKIISREFKNNLQGVFGFVDEKLFDKHREKVLELGNMK